MPDNNQNIERTAEFRLKLVDTDPRNPWLFGLVLDVDLGLSRGGLQQHSFVYEIGYLWSSRKPGFYLPALVLKEVPASGIPRATNDQVIQALRAQGIGERAHEHRSAWAGPAVYIGRGDELLIIPHARGNL